MRLVRLTIVALALLSLCAVNANAQPPATTARPGEKVVVIINRVKADRKEQFEDYMTKFLAASTKVAQSEPMIKAVHSQTRTLHPVKPNEDGTWTYVFLADPVVSDPKAYDMSAVLKKVYPQAEAERLVKQFLDSLAEGQEMIELVQTKM